ncbi:hypothetical protein CDAR_102771, partial [Caerostris darwini]
MKKKIDSFGETFNDEEDDPALFETLQRVQVGRNMQNLLGTGKVRDRSNELSSRLFHGTSGPRNPICTDMGAEGGQNVVRSSENMQQQKPTSNKRDISKTSDSRCSIRNKKMRTCEINPNKSSCQPLDLSISGTSYKTDRIIGGESSSSQKIQSNSSTSSKECLGSAFSSYKKSRDQRKKHVCVDCRKEFSVLSKLKIHMRVHTGERPYECNVCQNTFPYNSNLKDHMRVHTAVKPYSCEICQQTFTQLSSLDHHVAIHSGTKPHHCDYCDFETAQKPSLDKHLETQHSEHKEKCPVCCDYFYSEKSLQSYECKKALGYSSVLSVL